MFKFDAQDYPYASKRHVVYAKNGMSCVGNPSGAAAGLKVLLKGGNAIDAAVAVAAAQPVVEPTGNGLGADCFALIWYQGQTLRYQWFRSSAQSRLHCQTERTRL